jgi:hypothetical protein
MAALTIVVFPSPAVSIMISKVPYLKKDITICTKRRTRNKALQQSPAILAPEDLRVRRISK